MNDVRPYLTTGLSNISAQKSSESCFIVDFKLIEALFSKDKCIVQVAFGDWYWVHSTYKYTSKPSPLATNCESTKYMKRDFEINYLKNVLCTILHIHIPIMIMVF